MRVGEEPRSHSKAGQEAGGGEPYSGSSAYMLGWKRGPEDRGASGAGAVRARNQCRREDLWGTQGAFPTKI